MVVRRVSSAVSVISAATSLVLAPHASAAPCPQIEVVFARGRTEPPGTGRIGEAFVNALRDKTSKSVGVYAVDYPADTEVIQGANDMSKRIQYMAANCPNTRLVLGGYSLGAAVADIVLGAPTSMFGYTNPLPPSMNDYIAAVALFGNGTIPFFGPVSEVSPMYGGKTIDLCTDADPICSGNLDPNNPIGDAIGNWSAHEPPAYIDSGLADQAAAFAAARL
ncbi:MAG: cutinase family protein [Mycobacterium sp.]|nr:cutinase family protein [Mycobacterium sp.]